MKKIILIIAMMFIALNSYGDQVGVTTNPVQIHGHSSSFDGGQIHLPSFFVYRQAGLTLTSGSPTNILFDNTSIKNDNSWYAPATGKYQPTTAGYYLINLNLGATCATTVTQVEIFIVNGNSTVYYATPMISASFTGGSNQTLSASTIMFLNGTTDYVYGRIMITGTGTCSLATGTTANMSGMMLSY